MIKVKFFLSIFFVIGFSAVPGCQKMSEDAIHSKVYAIWNKGDLNTVDEVYAADFVRHESGWEDLTGTEALKQRVKEIRNTYPDFNITIEDMVIQGNKGATRYVIHATNKGPLKLPNGKVIPATGKKLILKGINFWHVKDGKVVEEFIVFDSLDAMRQLGLLP